MSGVGIAVPPEAIADFCEHHHIRRLSFFGSVLRDDFRPESDVDVLVEFESGVQIGLLGLARIEPELSALLGRKADVRTPAELSPYFREEVLRASRIQYAAQG